MVDGDSGGSGRSLTFGERVRLGPVTAGIAAFCLLLFVAGLARPELFERGVMVPDEVWSGQWWRLLTAIFLHVGIAHVAFNVLWWWQLGFAIEVRSGSAALLLLTVLGGVSGSFAELAFASLDYPGSVGLSGAVYGLFFFGFVALRPLGGPFGVLFSKKNAQVFVGWGLLCVLFTVTHILPVANFAHGAGALLGLLLGLVFAPAPRHRVITILAAGATVVVVVGLGFAGMMPIWTSRYQTFRGIQAFDARDFSAATRWLSKVSDDHPEAHWIQANLALSLAREGRMDEAVAAARVLPDSYLDGLKTPNARAMVWLRAGAPASPPTDGSGVGSSP